MSNRETESLFCLSFSPLPFETSPSKNQRSRFFTGRKQRPGIRKDDLHGEPIGKMVRCGRIKLVSGGRLPGFSLRQPFLGFFMSAELLAGHRQENVVPPTAGPSRMSLERFFERLD